MPSNPEHGGSVRLMTVTEIAEEYEISRQAIHDYRRRGIFPQPVQGEGSTRLRFRADEVREFFAANPKRPGKRTDLAPKQPGEDVSTSANPRMEILSNLSDPPYNEVTETRCTPWDEAVKLVNEYRAAVLAEAVAVLQAKAGELSTAAEEEMRRDLEEKAQVWHEAADEVAKLMRKTEES